MTDYYVKLDAEDFKRLVKIGKIKRVLFGFGGYQDAMFGISFSLGNDSWGVDDFWGQFPKTKVEDFDPAKDMNRVIEQSIVMDRITELLISAKVGSINELEGKQIEVEFLNDKLVGWRILTEAL